MASTPVLVGRALLCARARQSASEPSAWPSRHRHRVPASPVRHRPQQGEDSESGLQPGRVPQPRSDRVEASREFRPRKHRRPEPSTARHMGATDVRRSRSAPRVHTTARVTAGRSESRSRLAHTHSAGCETRRPNSTVNCPARTHRRASLVLQPLPGDGPSTPQTRQPQSQPHQTQVAIVGRVLLYRPHGWTDDVRLRSPQSKNALAA